MSVSIPAVVAQHSPAPKASEITIQGAVLDSAGNPVAGASVLVEQKDSSASLAAKTNSQGVFMFSALRPGTYMLSAESSGLHSRVMTVLAGEQKHIDLVLQASGVSTEARNSLTSRILLSLETHWTAVGGHGSDSSLRPGEICA